MENDWRIYTVQGTTQKMYTPVVNDSMDKHKQEQRLPTSFLVLPKRDGVDFLFICWEHETLTRRNIG